MGAHLVRIEFTVNASSREEAVELLQQRLPNPESDGHRVIDSWSAMFDFDAEFPPLTERQSQHIRDQFYADWIRGAFLAATDRDGFQRFVADMEKSVGDAVAARAAADASYGIVEPH